MALQAEHSSPTSCEPSHLPGLVPTARHEVVNVVEQIQLARDTFRLRLACPELARQAVPGQFFMIRSPDRNNPLLARPFALYDTYVDAAGDIVGIDIVYLVVGKMTRLMSTWAAGDRVEIWGPLGNGFPVPAANHLLLVAGGIGQTPLLAVAREVRQLRRYGQPPRNFAVAPRTITFCYGVRSAEFLAGLDDFASTGIEVRLATDDGSRGHRGFVTDLVAEAIQSSNSPDAIYCCGPEPMMHAVGRLAMKHNVPCWLSLETPMACGFGACFSCVTRVQIDADEWDYRRVCVEGPVFPAHRLAFASP
jgi:dihydroorotate dehydrogenase electron transfer subunit